MPLWLCQDSLELYQSAILSHVARHDAPSSEKQDAAPVPCNLQLAAQHSSPVVLQPGQCLCSRACMDMRRSTCGLQVMGRPGARYQTWKLWVTWIGNTDSMQALLQATSVSYTEETRVPDGTHKAQVHPQYSRRISLGASGL